MAATIDRKRLAEVRKRGLKNGAHRSVEQGTDEPVQEAA
jgi:hypothetical protein